MIAAMIPGTVVPNAPTSRPGAWLGPYRTLRLQRDVEAMRVHVGAGEGAATRPELVSGAGALGRWFAIGDVVLSRSDYVDAQALPAGFSDVELCVLRAGSIVNVGLCGPLFGRGGGGEQIEFVSGPTPALTEIGGNWVDEYGHA